MKTRRLQPTQISLWRSELSRPWVPGWLSCVFVGGCLLLLLAIGSPTSPAVAAASARCVKPQSRLIASGRNPEGGRWTVTGTVRDEERCHYWLFGMSFSPLGTRLGTWTDGWEIPVGGHLTNSFSIAALDQQLSPSYRVITGVTGANVKSVELVLSSGQRLMIHPKVPAEGLRKSRSWLRRMGYFIRYYPTGRFVKGARVIGPQGEVLERVHQLEGEIDGLPTG